MQKNDISLNNVKRHYDFDPGHKYRTMDYGQNRFLNMINNSVLPKPDEPTQDQIFKVEDNFYCEEKFIVLATDIPTNAIKINVGSRDIWVYASSCIGLVNQK